MMTVTVEARCDGGRDHRFAERHGLAVVSIAIMFEAIFVTLAAACVAGHFEMPVLWRLDAVCGVAIRAHWATFVALSENLSVDAFLVNLFNPDVTLAAGLGDVGVVDGRVAIHATLDIMDAVAVVARRRNDKPHLQQRAAVDAVFVLRRGLRELHLVFLREPGVGVAGGACIRQV